MPAWLKWLTLVLLVVLILFLLLVFSDSVPALVPLHAFLGKVWDRIWLWVIGLSGTLLAGFKRIGKLFGPSRAAAELQAKNDAIKDGLARLQEQLADFDVQLKRERDLHRREMAVYQAELDRKERESAAIRADLAKLRAQTPEQHVLALPAEERRQFEQEANKDVWVYGQGPLGG